MAALKENLGWPSMEPFYVPAEVYANYRAISEAHAKEEDAWNEMFAEYCSKYPEMKELFDRYYDESAADKLIDDEEFWKFADKPEATRNLSGMVINRIKDILPNFVGGSADLAPSNKTYMKDAKDFSKEDYSGRNFHFGVRELAMAAIGNGIVLHLSLIHI